MIYPYTVRRQAKMKKFTIKVLHQGVVIDQIVRVLKAESMGNFNPFFCRYRNKQYLVQSKMGDLSDPFRRDLDYFKDLYIEVFPFQGKPGDNTSVSKKEPGALQN